MCIAIQPFSECHLDAAAALLAARHRDDRRWAPALSPGYEDPIATMSVLRELVGSAGMRGVVALRDERLVAYLLGAPELRSPTRTFAGFMHPRAAEIPYAAHAVELADGAALSSRLYADLARTWVTQGLVGHYVTVPAHPHTTELWSDLGFGRFLAFAVRATTTPDAGPAPEPMALEIRRSTAADEAAIQEAMTAFFRSFADPPIFVPFLLETAAERGHFVTEHLADPACPCWLACDQGRVVGLQLFVEPTSAHWGQSPLETPERSLYLHIAYTVPEARSTGVGAALLRHTMAWARAAGYDYCTAHFVTASRAAPFWRSRGFQPVSYRLYRGVDERATWATGRD